MEELRRRVEDLQARGRETASSTVQSQVKVESHSAGTKKRVMIPIIAVMALVAFGLGAVLNQLQQSEDPWALNENEFVSSDLAGSLDSFESNLDLDDLTAITDVERNAEIQTALVAMKFNPSNTSGNWDDSSEIAAKAYQRVRGITPADGQPTDSLLRSVSAAASSGFSNLSCKTVQESEPYDEQVCDTVNVPVSQNLANPVYQAGVPCFIPNPFDYCDLLGNCNYLGMEQYCEADYSGAGLNLISNQCAGTISDYEPTCNCDMNGCYCQLEANCNATVQNYQQKQECRTETRTRTKSRETCSCQATESCLR